MRVLLTRATQAKYHPRYRVAAAASENKTKIKKEEENGKKKQKQKKREFHAKETKSIKKKRSPERNAMGIPIARNPASSMASGLMTSQKKIQHTRTVPDA
jgi:hypothetical protein